MTTTRPAALALSAILALTSLTACSDDDPAEGGSQGATNGSAEESTKEPTEEPTQDDERGAGEVLDAAVDATLANPRASIESLADLQIAGQQITLETDGRVDYDAVVVDSTLQVTQSGSSQRVEILADGETFWVAAEGAQVPPFPDGATYLAGDVERLAEAETFTQDSLVGIVLVLRSGADADAEEGDTEEIDGVETRSFTYTVPYTDALEAAGDDAEALRSALSLTGDAEQADLEVEVAVGSDDVVRRLEVEIDGGTVPVSGTYDLALSDVGAEVEPPEAPADDEVARGPQADALLDQLIT